MISIISAFNLRST